MAFLAAFTLFASFATIIENQGQALAGATTYNPEAQTTDIHSQSPSKKPQNARFQKSTIRTALIKNADHILNLTGKDIQSIFAKPELVRAETPTIIWQYRNQACVLDIYFQASKNKSNLKKAKAQHYELRARNKHTPDNIVKNRCMADLARARSGITTVSIDAFKK